VKHEPERKALRELGRVILETKSLGQLDHFLFEFECLDFLFEVLLVVASFGSVEIFQGGLEKHSLELACILLFVQPILVA